MSSSENAAQVKALIPRSLKRRIFTALASQDAKFSPWLRTQLETWVEELEPNETFIVANGIHHKILRASDNNRLLVVSIPPYHPDDENPSDKI